MLGPQSARLLFWVWPTVPALKELVLFCAAAKPSTSKVNSSVGVYIVPRLYLEKWGFGETVGQVVKKCNARSEMRRSEVVVVTK